MAVQVAAVPFNQRTIRLEYQWLNAEMTDAPLIVFLHEGLGSLSMWKNYPQQLCDAAQCRGLVYSRYGYGNSTPQHWWLMAGIGFLVGLWVTYSALGRRWNQ